MTASPPVTLMLSFNVRSSLPVVPSAASVMFPPSLFTTGLPAATVSQVLERIVMSSLPLLAGATASVIVTLDRPLKLSIVKPPARSWRWMSPHSVTAASVLIATSMSASLGAWPAPIPLPARKATWSPVMLAASLLKVSLIAPTLSLA